MANRMHLSDKAALDAAESHGPLAHYSGAMPEGAPSVCTAQWTKQDFATWQETQDKRQVAVEAWLKEYGSNVFCPYCAAGHCVGGVVK
jgi:hypothetical protein